MRSFQGQFFNSELSNFRLFKVGPKSSQQCPQTVPKAPSNHPKSVPIFSEKFEKCRQFFDFFRTTGTGTSTSTGTTCSTSTSATSGSRITPPGASLGLLFMLLHVFSVALSQSQAGWLLSAGASGAPMQTYPPRAQKSYEKHCLFVVVFCEFLLRFRGSFLSFEGTNFLQNPSSCH